MTVLIATRNRHKLEEIRAILADVPDIEWLPLDESLPEAPEEGETFEENAQSKALFYARATGLPTLADDSGLVVDALGGAPGVRSARWLGQRTPYTVKNQHLLDLLAGVEGQARSARFVAVAALAWPDGRVALSRGSHEGRVHHEISGQGGFGYDPIFYSDEAGQTFGTLSEARKNELSHRARALRGLRRVLSSMGGT